jgi:hypothetical protein
MLHRQGPAIGQMDFKRFERPRSVHLPELFDGHLTLSLRAAPSSDGYSPRVVKKNERPIDVVGLAPAAESALRSRPVRRSAIRMPIVRAAQVPRRCLYREPVRQMCRRPRTDRPPAPVLSGRSRSRSRRPARQRFRSPGIAWFARSLVGGGTRFRRLSFVLWFFNRGLGRARGANGPAHAALAALPSGPKT